MNPSTEIGVQLRRWRGRLPPARAGLAPAANRRVPGLRRAEVAQLAGVSVDYLTQLEQGRVGPPSPEVLHALADALQLSRAETEHLVQLAGYRVTGTSATAPPAHALRLIRQLDAQPAAIYDRSWYPLAWNPLWAAIHGDPAQRRGQDRNMVWRHFAASATRVQRPDVTVEALQLTLAGDLRVRYGRHPGDATLAHLVEQLRAHQPRFHAMWERGEIDSYHHERKTFLHPDVGRLTLDCDILPLDGQQEHQAIVYTAAPQSRSATQLRRLLGRIDDASVGVMDVSA